MLELVRRPAGLEIDDEDLGSGDHPNEQLGAVEQRRPREDAVTDGASVPTPERPVGLIHPICQECEGRVGIHRNGGADAMSE
jgi:hypothetical protein